MKKKNNLKKFENRKLVYTWPHVALKLVQPIQWWGLDACLESLPAAHNGLLAAPNTQTAQAEQADMWGQQCIICGLMNSSMKTKWANGIILSQKPELTCRIQ